MSDDLFKVPSFDATPIVCSVWLLHLDNEARVKRVQKNVSFIATANLRFQMQHTNLKAI
jgi:hypothetical protein